MAATLYDTSLPNMLLQYTANRLSQKLLSEPTDSAKAGLVRAGLLQDDPTRKKINILVHTGGERYPDVLNNQPNQPGMFGPSFEIGGARRTVAYFRRRVLIEFIMFYPNNLNEADATTRSNVVMSRAIHAMLTTDFRDIGRDTMGESSYQLSPIHMYIGEGGGPGDYNWRGEIVMEFMTHFSPRIDSDP